MWLFLLTEILFFGGLFVAYMIYRIWYFEAFAEASRRLSLFWGGLNTAVLIGSSLTMALAVRAAQTNNRKWTVNWLILTTILGCVFLGVKVIEYQDKFANYEVPGEHYNWLYHEQHAAAAVEHAEGAAPAAAESHRQLRMTPEQLQNTTQIYFSLYFTMTGLHALHMIIGVGLMLVITWMAWKGKFDAQWYTPVEMSGLYWHFVDIVWIFLFPLLYLVERHQ
jgi:cytochrome c oxidase subunit 3